MPNQPQPEGEAGAPGCGGRCWVWGSQFLRVVSGELVRKRCGSSSQDEQVCICVCTSGYLRLYVWGSKSNHSPSNSNSGPNLGCWLTISPSPTTELIALVLGHFFATFQAVGPLRLEMWGQPSTCRQPHFSTALMDNGTLQCERGVTPTHPLEPANLWEWSDPGGLNSETMQVQSALWSWTNLSPKPQISHS